MAQGALTGPEPGPNCMVLLARALRFRYGDGSKSTSPGVELMNTIRLWQYSLTLTRLKKHDGQFEKAYTNAPYYQ